jgi:hypothetical protein
VGGVWVQMNESAVCVTRKMSLSVRPRDVLERADGLALCYVALLTIGPDHSSNGRASHQLDCCYWES